jgi:hypothetical protein
MDQDLYIIGTRSGRIGRLGEPRSVGPGVTPRPREPAISAAGARQNILELSSSAVLMTYPGSDNLNEWSGRFAPSGQTCVPDRIESISGSAGMVCVAGWSRSVRGYSAFSPEAP